MYSILQKTLTFCLEKSHVDNAVVERKNALPLCLPSRLLQRVRPLASTTGKAVPGTLASLTQVHRSLVPSHLKQGVCSVNFDAFVIMFVNANSI